LLKALNRTVIEIALDEEMAEHLGSYADRWSRPSRPRPSLASRTPRVRPATATAQRSASPIR
jgi:hypothetical protein